MSKYGAPGVYVESIPSVVSVDDSLSTGIGGFIGTAERGPAVPVLISSWQEYIDTFAYGMDSPFLSNADLAFAVYGFFQNGGKQCYVQRSIAEDAAQSSATVSYTPAGSEDPVTLFTLKAIEGGTWGNNLSCSLKAYPVTRSGPAVYCLTIKFKGVAVETIESVWSGLSSAIASSRFVELVGTSFNSTDPLLDSEAAALTANFTGGANTGSANLDYWKFGEMIDRLNYITDVDLVTQSSDLYPIVEERKETVLLAYSSVRVVNDSNLISPEKVIVYYPKVNVSDPLNSGSLREVTPVGHVMGIFARIAQERGIWKAPAGTECVLKGVVSVSSNVNIESLRNAGVNAIIYKPNYGVVIWGARTQALNNDMAYVTDVFLDCYIKDAIDTVLQPAVFEPNNSALWIRVKADIESILDTLWRAGGLAGSESNQAYYVKCDEELNPESVRDAGELRVEVGYARSRPAEFIIVRVAHSINRS